MRFSAIIAAGFGACVLQASASQAAQQFEFSFSNVNGGVNGTVTGDLFLPDGDGTFGALSILIDSAPAALGYTLPYSVLTNMPIIVTNTFTVSNHVITAGTYASQNSTEAFTLNYFQLGSLLSIKGSGSASTGVQDGTNSTLQYSFVSPATATPEPASMVVLLSGMIGLAAAARRRH